MTLPAGTYSLGEGVFSFCTRLRAVSLSEGTHLLPVSGNQSAFSGCDLFGAYTVPAANPWHTTVDGILYSKDITELVSVPYATESLTIPAGVLIATGLVKAMLTPALINLGWRGGHFFPVIFSGVSLGYGLAILTGADPVFCVAVCTASTMGAVMRQPVMVVGLLLMCFPLKGIVCMIIAAVIAAGIPLPKPLRK